MATLWSQALNGFNSAEIVDAGCTTSLNTSYGSLLTATTVDATNNRAERAITGAFTTGTEGRLFVMAKLPSTSSQVRFLDTFTSDFGTYLWQVYIQNTQLTLAVGATMRNAGASTVATALSPGLWNAMTVPIEVAWKEDDYVRLYVGGTLAASFEGITSSAGAGAFAKIVFGIPDSQSSTAKTVKIGQGILTNDAATALWTRNATPVLSHPTKYGMHQDLGYESSAGVRTIGYQALDYIDATVSRHTLLWDRVEATDGAAYDWDLFDEIVDGVEQRGAEVLFMASSTPTWLNGGDDKYDIPGTGLDATFTTWVADFCTFITAAVNRYKAGGTFGSNVRKWDIWNEPNLNAFWTPSGNSPDQYAYLYEEVRDAIVAADSSAQIGFGVFSTWLFIGSGMSGMEFMGELLLRGVTFDRLSLHAYDGGDPTVNADFDDNFTDYAATATTHHFPAHEYLELIGREVPMWLTEFGWNVSLTEAVQGAYVADALDMVETYWSAFTEVVTLFSDRDIGGTTHGVFDYTVGAQPEPRPAAVAFRSFMDQGLGPRSTVDSANSAAGRGAGASAGAVANSRRS